MYLYLTQREKNTRIDHLPTHTLACARGYRCAVWRSVSGCAPQQALERAWRDHIGGLGTPAHALLAPVHAHAHAHVWTHTHAPLDRPFAHTLQQPCALNAAKFAVVVVAAQPLGRRLHAATSGGGGPL